MATNEEVLTTTTPTNNQSTTTGTTAGLNTAGTTTTAALDSAQRNQAQAQAKAGKAAGIDTAYLNNYMTALGGGVDHSNEINSMYQGLLDSNLAQLNAANQINQNQYEQNRQQLIEDYENQRNSAATDHERNRYNLNQQISSNGLNVGTGSQAALAMNNQYQANQTALGKAKMKAEAELNQNIANLNIQYQADIATAIGENDYQKAAALYQDKLDREKQMTTYYQMITDEANTRASYGDFSVMKQIYGKEAADMALQVWATQNPQAAYDQGQITAQEFKNITGAYPRGYTPKSSTGVGSNGSPWENSWYYRTIKAKNDWNKNHPDKQVTLSEYQKLAH